MLPNPPREGYCTARVSHGRMGLFNCSNAAVPGDDLCGTHRAARERREAAPLILDPTGPATVETERSVRARLEWEKGSGPVFPPSRYANAGRDVMWRWITASTSLPLEMSRERVRLSGGGLVLRKDGTPGMVQAELRFADWDHLPETIQQLLTDALTATTEETTP